jgi:hypothetical protein
MSLRAVASSFQSVNYQGTWDASANTPTLTSSVGTKGHYYVVSVAGSTNLNGITNWGVGDWAVFNGSAWQRVEGGADGNFVNLSASGTASFANGTASAPSITITNDTNTGIFSPAADTLSVSTNGTERVRVDNVGLAAITGTLGVKTTASGEYNILVGGTLTGGSNSGGLRFQSQIQSDVTSNVRGLMSIPSTAAASFTLGNLEHFFAGQGSLGLGSAITSQYGYRAASSLIGATNNFGFYGDIASGTNRWNFYAAGTAANYFAGSVGIGTATPNASALLDVQSTSKGVRMPNMTTTQKNAISSPAAGLMVFDTTLAKLCVYTGAAWETITSV